MRTRTPPKSPGPRVRRPRVQRLLDAARRSLERTGGDLTRTVTVKSPDDRERRAIIEITGQYCPEGVGVLAVRLADLDHAVREATGQGLAQLLNAWPAAQGPPGRAAATDDGREAALSSAEDSFLTARAGFRPGWRSSPPTGP